MNAQCSVHSRSVQEVWQRRDSLEDEERSGWPLAVDNDQLRAITKGDPLTTTWEVAKELNTDHYMVIRHLKQIGKVKKLGKWVPHELTKNQKIVVLKCCVLLFYTTMNHFLIGLWRVMKSGFYNRRCPSQWLDQEEAPKHFWKPHLDQNKVMVTVWWSAAHHYSFLNPSKIVISEKCAQQINEMYWKLQCLQLTCNWSTKWPVTGQQKEPSFSPWQCLTTHCITSFKSSMNGLRGFASSIIFTWPLTNQQPLPWSISKTIFRQNASTASRRKKMLSKSSLNPEAWVFMLQE